MPKKAEYRNALRSKALIKDSFVTLMQAKPLEKITVTDVVNKAQINRGTFYAHYTDIDMLITTIEDEIVQTLCSLLYDLRDSEPLAAPLPLFLKISEYLEANKELIFALMHANNTSAFIFRLPDLITEQLISSGNIDNNLRNDPLFKTRCRFYAGGATSLYTAWFQGHVEGSLEDVAYMLKKIIREQNPHVGQYL